ncbi:MAG: apolipoprotein N-acyltransferase, partial [Deltaproteobacteria bacterium]|nr:apolipoprotein N-acyltransferase [Deltaproteobacteria bacterium]
LLYPFLRDSRFRLLLSAGAWIGLEYLRGRLLTGLPWCFLGHSQAARIQLIQISDLAGVYGVGFLVAAANLLVFHLVFDPRMRKNRTVVVEGAVVAILLSLTLVYGHLKTREPAGGAPFSEPVRTAIVQGNIDQSQKWLPEHQEKTLQTYRRLSLRAARQNPDLIVWPETAVPFFFQDPSRLSAGVLDIPESTGADLLFGSPAYKGSGRQTRYANRAYLLSAEDRRVESYDKVHLVPFGEYVPLQRFLPFVHRLVPAAGDFRPGDRVEPLEAPGYSAGVLICFEAIFPGLARRQVEQGADILVNLTNDAWFGPTSAPFQHLSMSVFRAVETRRPLVRAANTGISAFVDVNGRVTRSSGLFQEAVLMSEVYPSTLPPTPYVRTGDLFPLFLLASIFVKLVVFGNRRRTRRQRTRL